MFNGCLGNYHHQKPERIISKDNFTLKQQTFKGKYEIIVVDSGSTDGAKEYCRSQKVKLVNIPSQNFNYANALNKGARVAEGRYLVRLSGDCIPQGKTF